MDRSRYRYVNFIGGRILQAREMDELQDITRGVDDSNYPSVFDLNALYAEGATFNVTAVITPNTKTVTLTAVDGDYPMLVFVRGRWEVLKSGEAPALTLTTGQTHLYLNWQLTKVTYGAVDGDTTDSLLKDVTTSEAAAEMGELRLQVSATDDSLRAVDTNTEFEKNTESIVVFAFTHTSTSLTRNVKNNVVPQALASRQSAGFVTTTTDTTIAVSTDDPRMMDARAPADGSVHDATVRTPLRDGVATNADGTPRYDLTKDIGGISSAKIVHQHGTQLLSDAVENITSSVVALDAALGAHEGAHLGLDTTHPFPTAGEVGATPQSHQALGLEQAHGLAASKNAGGLTITRDKAVAATAADGAVVVKDQDGDLAKLTHDGDVFAKAAAGFIAAAKLEGADTGSSIGNGPLSTLAAVAKALAAHINKTSHKNPHGLTLGDLGYAAPDVPPGEVVDLDPVLAAAKAYADQQLVAAKAYTDARTHIWGESYNNWLIIHFYKFDLAFGSGRVGNGGGFGPPGGGWNAIVGGAMSGVNGYLSNDGGWIGMDFEYNGGARASMSNNRGDYFSGDLAVWCMAYRAT